MIQFSMKTINFHVAFLGIFLILVYLAGIANSRTAINIPKCMPENDACVGQTLTKIIHHRAVLLEHSESRIPNLKPYTPPNPWEVTTRNSNIPIDFAGNWSNISLYGFDQTIVRQISLPYHLSMYNGVRSNETNDKIKGKLLIPLMQVYANFESEMKLFMWPVDVEGFFNFNLTKVEISLISDCNVIHRDGKDYVNITRMHLQLHASEFSKKTKYDNIGPFISRVADEVLDSYWELLIESINHDLETHLGEVIEKMLTPIFDSIAIQDFFHQGYAPQAKSLNEDGNNGRVTKMASRVLVLCIMLFAQMYQLVFIL